MASILQVEQIKGPTSGASANTITIPSGQTLDVSDATVSGNDNTPNFGANASSTQSISTGVWTKVQMDTEAWDTDGAYDPTTNYRFTVPTGKGGRYLINAGLEFGSIPSSTIAQCTIRKNGSSVAGSSQRDYPPGSTADVKWTLSTIMNLSDGDYIEMWVYQNSGSSKNLTQHEMFFGGFRLL